MDGFMEPGLPNGSFVAYVTKEPDDQDVYATLNVRQTLRHYEIDENGMYWLGDFVVEEKLMLDQVAFDALFYNPAGLRLFVQYDRQEYMLSGIMILARADLLLQQLSTSSGTVWLHLQPSPASRGGLE